MKKLMILISVLAFTALSCKNRMPKELGELGDELKSIEKSAETKQPTCNTGSKKPFTVKAGYIRFKNQAGKMEMTREFWFDDYGLIQYEENYMEIMGSKAGSSSLVTDGFRYNWDFGKTTGSKIKASVSAVVDYNNMSKEDIARYGVKQHGHENVSGKRCQKVSIEKPVKGTSWMWEGIVLKTISSVAGQDILMEAVEIKEGNIEPGRLHVPREITFNQIN